MHLQGRLVNRLADPRLNLPTVIAFTEVVILELLVSLRVDTK